MAGGRVFITGTPGDTLREWMIARVRASGYQPVVLSEEDEGRDTSAGAPLTLGSGVAGLDLWRVAGEERFEAIALLDERLTPGRPLLSLCSAFSADEAASYAVHGERVVGFSVFGPLREGTVAEVLPGLGSAPRAVERAIKFLRTLELTPETLPPGSWAVLPRVLATIVNEAAFAIAEGVASAPDIDTAMRLGVNYARGPLELADEIGLGEILAVLEALQAEYGDDRYRPAPLLRRLVLAGYTGKAAGRGFHTYS